MDEKEILRKVAKFLMLKWEPTIVDAETHKRKLGKVAKEIGVPVDELREVVDPMIRELVDEMLAE